MSYRFIYAAFYSFIWNEQIQLFTGLFFSREKREENTEYNVNVATSFMYIQKKYNKIYLKVLFRMADSKIHIG